MLVSVCLSDREEKRREEKKEKRKMLLCVARGALQLAFADHLSLDSSLASFLPSLQTKNVFQSFSSILHVFIIAIPDPDPIDALIRDAHVDRWQLVTRLLRVQRVCICHVRSPHVSPPPPPATIPGLGSGPISHISAHISRALRHHRRRPLSLLLILHRLASFIHSFMLETLST